LTALGPGTASLAEVAYFHEPYWGPRDGDWVKSLLLFFDGVALLVPEYMRDRPLFTDPVLAQPLDQLGLLHRLSPEQLVDQATAEAIAALIDELLRVDAFAGADPGVPFQELSYSRLGHAADAALTDTVLKPLRDRGLARDSADGVSVPLHPVVRAAVLTALPQLLRAPAEAAGWALQPASPSPQRLYDLVNTLRLPFLPTAGHVASLDVEQVTLDLSSVPLDEVLGYREQHGEEHRRYARDLRAFARELALLEPAARETAFADRREELADAADALRRLARKAWRRPLATFGLGLAGSAVALGAGNPVGAGLTAAGALLGLRRQADPASAYTYLFQAQSSLSACRSP
jgi:hypothetical protein